MPTGGGKTPILDLNGAARLDRRATANAQLLLIVVAHLSYIHNTE
jgi:hypothetical protein